MSDVPVVLVHGWGGSFAQTWQAPGFAALLEDAGREVIGVDLLGHGDAPKPHDVEAYTDLTRRIEEALPASGQVDAVGFSMGAITLLELAGRRPERFHRLVVAGIGASLFVDDPERHEAIIAAVEGRGDPGDIGSAVFAHYAQQPGNDPVALAAILKRPRRVWHPDDLAPVTCPTLVVIGDRDFAGPGEPLAEALPDARLVTLRGVDHFATPESFGFIDSALEFLEAVPE
jgi:pimeloyl-ACP methyl ester carboxylesterase